MLRSVRGTGRHRLGTPGLVHCGLLPGFHAALDKLRRSRFWSLGPSQHTLTGLRRRGANAAAARAWMPDSPQQDLAAAA
ncbi:hypothetical protein D5S17_25940 [Pseudonocardiaceae bacterium YIM PH 21723]|nr:hypothetical protein D5S17_25940 [Pseudonocardiaceae bacterium YIM PH 21723]